MANRLLSPKMLVRDIDQAGLVHEQQMKLKYAL
jgi:hypothetical protein